MRKNRQVLTVRCRQDNYAYLLPLDDGTCLLIDAPEAAPIVSRLAAEGLRLRAILLTHHHGDHVEGVEALRAPGVEVIGAAADAHRLPPLDRAVAPGEEVEVGGLSLRVLDAPGHTIGHVAYHVAARSALFSGDSLMVHGCGRLFEGTPAQMQASIAAMDRLPEDTAIFSGHDYAEANLAFAATMAPDPGALARRHAALALCADEGWPTTGVTLAEDRALNPYLRVHLPQVQAAVDMPGAEPVAVLAEIRRRKDRF
ncbi:MAG: hydroxyacylglutathione hydrolase [Rhodobacterales bacterium]|nr:hydroxyacylglutathione hydrolase [Rhodobacterales bacterium]